MSSNSITSNTGRQLFVNTDLSKIFIWSNRYNVAPYNNSAYSSTTLLAGTLMGRVSSTGYIKPLASGASDGSQLPVGILAEDVVVDGGAIVNLNICNGGDIAQEKIIFQGTDNLDVTVGSQRLCDLIHQAGLRLVTTTEMTDYDNS